jgi:hypothetical protein
MGFFNKISGAINKGLDMYDQYRDIRGVYRDAVPRGTRRQINRSVGRGFQKAGDLGRRAIGGISTMIKKRRNPDRYMHEAE